MHVINSLCQHPLSKHVNEPPYQFKLPTQVINALYQRALSKHCVNTLYQSKLPEHHITLSKHDIKAVYQHTSSHHVYQIKLSTLIINIFVLRITI